MRHVLKVAIAVSAAGTLSACANTGSSAAPGASRMGSGAAERMAAEGAIPNASGAAGATGGAIAGGAGSAPAASAGPPAAAPMASAAAPTAAPAPGASAAASSGGSVDLAHSRQTFQQVCSTCHEAALATDQRHTRAGWQQVVDRMYGFGMSATDAQAKEIVDYLSTTYPAR